MNINTDSDINAILNERQCKILEIQCTQYVKDLERINRNLVIQIKRQQNIEAQLKKKRKPPTRNDNIKPGEEQAPFQHVILLSNKVQVPSYGGIIGKSLAINNIFAQIERVAPTHANVLISGESGTGKELIAREIHKRSHRNEYPLVKVNCATIPSDLFESEFFGHIKGAFTGAVKDRIGRFESADQGTIFLDEVGEIPIALQSKLLRVIQEGQYERVGEDRTRKVNVRIIAATNRNLSEEVKAKRFRNDLFYRLNVIPIHVPPLRDHKDDIGPLAIHFIDKLSKKLNIPTPRLSSEKLANMIENLTSYDWPGNVRELENAIQRVLILFDDHSLNLPYRADSYPQVQLKSEKRLESTDRILTIHELKEMERNNIVKALNRCHFKIYGKDGAAALLEIKPTTLIEKIKRLHIEKPS